MYSFNHARKIQSLNEKKKAQIHLMNSLYLAVKIKIGSENVSSIMSKETALLHFKSLNKVVNNFLKAISEDFAGVWLKEWFNH